MKKENGYIILDKEKMTKYQNLNLYWFLIDKKEYLFKIESKYSYFSELFGEQVAIALEIPTVSYDLAWYMGKMGVLTKSYNLSHKQEVSLENILYKFYDEFICKHPKDFPNEMFLQNAHNLEDIWGALEYYYKDCLNKELIVQKLMQQILDSFILQLCLGNDDLHYKNIVILEGEDLSLAPNFDYGRIGLIDFETNINNYALQVKPLSFNDKNNAISTIRSFVNESDENIVRYMKQKVLMLPTSDEIIQSIETEKQIKIEKEIKDYLSMNYNTYKSKILEVILEKRIGFYK